MAHLSLVWTLLQHAQGMFDPMTLRIEEMPAIVNGENRENIYF